MFLSNIYQKFYFNQSFLVKSGPSVIKNWCWRWLASFYTVWYQILLIFNYPGGFKPSNLFFILALLLSSFVAYFSRIFGLEQISNFCIAYLVSNIYLLPYLVVLIILNKIYLKFYIFTKFYSLRRYSTVLNIPVLKNRI
jgi:hypothetical protein